jgi:subtilisin
MGNTSGIGRERGVMRNRLSLLIGMGVAMLVACAGVVLAQPTGSDGGTSAEADLSSLEAGDPIPNRYVVVFDGSVADPGSLASSLSRRLGFEVTHVYRYALDGFAAELTREDVTALSTIQRVDFVARDRVAEASGQAVPAGIKRIDAPQSSTAAVAGSAAVDVDIAILDTGIYKQHEDLNITGGVDCSGRDTGAWGDGDGHGTHVAGTAAARDNRIGVVGVAPGARLRAVKVLNNNGSGSFGDIICGIDWVTARADTIEVANMSLGATVTGVDDTGCGWTGNSAANALSQAVCQSVNAGVFYAVAAGNSSINFANDVPASFDQVLTVTAMADFDGKPGGDSVTVCGAETDDRFASFSNYATAATPDEDHTIAAPGVCVRSTWNNGGYKTISGTSMATPHVTGTAALCIVNGDCPANDPQGTLNRLRTDAQQKAGTNPTAADYYGFIGDPNTAGIVNYYGFLEYAGGY